jgi:putative oxidoreductase
MKENLASQWKAYTPHLLSFLRIASAYIFIQSGTVKLFGFPVSMPNGMHLEMWSQVWIGGMLEVVGGAFLLVGFFTRPVAFILAGEMAIAYFQFHAPKGFWIAENGGGNAMLFCFLFFYFSAAGGGPWSLDAWLRKK